MCFCARVAVCPHLAPPPRLPSDYTWAISHQLVFREGSSCVLSFCGWWVFVCVGGSLVNKEIKVLFHPVAGPRSYWSTPGMNTTTRTTSPVRPDQSGPDRWDSSGILNAVLGVRLVSLFIYRCVSRRCLTNLRLSLPFPPFRIGLYTWIERVIIQGNSNIIIIIIIAI